jgi:hypothetical protein
MRVATVARRPRHAAIGEAGTRRCCQNCVPGRNPRPRDARAARVAQRDMRMRLVQTRHVELRTSIGMSSTSS